MEEAELIQRSQAGDMDAFEELLLRYEKKVYSIAYKYMGGPEDAGDLAQEALIKAWQSIGSFRGESSFGTWLGRITSNCCLDALRRRKRIQTTSLDELIELDEGSVRRELPAPQDTPEEAVIRRETVQYVQSLLGQMREEYRIVLVMRELEGRSYEEIAALLSCSLGTVKSRIFRARAFLKEQILQDQAAQTHAPQPSSPAEDIQTDASGDSVPAQKERHRSGAQKPVHTGTDEKIADTGARAAEGGAEGAH